MGLLLYFVLGLFFIFFISSLLWNKLLAAAPNKDMAASQPVRDPAVGTILWIKGLSPSEVQETHGLPPDYFMHPCVVLHVSVSRKGFVQIYVVRPSRSPWNPLSRALLPIHDSGEQITSKSGRN